MSNKVETITIKQAQGLMVDSGMKAVSEPTIIAWCKDKKVGYQIAGRGRWYIVKVKFMGLIGGN